MIMQIFVVAHSMMYCIDHSNPSSTTRARSTLPQARPFHGRPGYGRFLSVLASNDAASQLQAQDKSDIESKLRRSYNYWMSDIIHVANNIGHQIDNVRVARPHKPPAAKDCDSKITSICRPAQQTVQPTNFRQLVHLDQHLLMLASFYQMNAIS